MACGTEYILCCYLLLMRFVSLSDSLTLPSQQKLIAAAIQQVQLMVNKQGSIAAPAKSQGFNSSTPGATYSQTTNPTLSLLPTSSTPPVPGNGAPYQSYPPLQYPPLPDPSFAGVPGSYPPQAAYHGYPPLSGYGVVTNGHLELDGLGQTHNASSDPSYGEEEDMDENQSGEDNDVEDGDDADAEVKEENENVSSPTDSKQNIEDQQETKINTMNV